MLGIQNDLALESSATLFDAILACGVAAKRYRELLDDVLELSKHSARKTIYWTLGAVEATIKYVPPDGEARSSFWHNTLNGLEPFRSQLTPLQLTALDELRVLVGLPSLTFTEVESGDMESFGRRLGGQRVAIYTLTRDAAQNAKEVLCKISDSVKISLHDDHVATPSLKAAAEGADIFVVVTWSAKHAATGYIQQHRPKDKVTLYAPGRGATGIIRVIDEYLEKGAPTT